MKRQGIEKEVGSSNHSTNLVDVDNETISQSSYSKADKANNFISRKKSGAFLLPIVCLLFFLGWYEYYLTHTLQTEQLLRKVDLTDKADHNAEPYLENFDYKLAKNHLIKLTNFGPRVTGSITTEKLVTNWIVQEVKKIKGDVEHNLATKKFSNNMKIDIDVQRPSSHFTLSFLHGMHNIYNNVTNVIVRLSWPDSMPPEDGKEHALLINAHYDSVPGSPGAADDGIGIAVMLELVRALSYGKPQSYPIILLFNGAEEWVHQAAHGFVTQHPWAKEVKYLINLEAIGSGGQELVFQCNSGEFAQIYGSSVPHPQASVMAHELFKYLLNQAASTDWFIFLKYGPPGMQGMDTAYVENGYVYHTALDSLRAVPDTTIQNTGENILSLTRALTDQQKLQSFLNPHGLSTSPSTPGDESYAVFFDLFFLKLIVYSGLHVTFVHGLCIAIGLAAIFYFIKISNGRISIGLIKAALKDEAKVTGLGLTLAAVYGILAHFFFPMRWYNGGIPLILVEFLPVLSFNMLFIRHYVQSNKPFSNPLLRQLTVMIIWLGATIICFLFRIMSGYLGCMWIINLSFSSVIYWWLKQRELSQFSTAVFEDKKADDKPGELLQGTALFQLDVACLEQSDELCRSGIPRRQYLFSPEFWYLLSLSPMIMYSYRLFDATTTMVIPLLGKIGAIVPADLVISLIVFIFIHLPSGSLFANEVDRICTKQKKAVGYVFLLVIVACYGYVIFGTVSYSDLHPKRLWIQHLHRKYTNKAITAKAGTPAANSNYLRILSSSSSQNSRYIEDFGLWVIAFDSQGFSPIQQMINHFEESQHLPNGRKHEVQKVDCYPWNGNCYFQFPWYFPVSDALRDSIYLATEKPPAIPKEEEMHMFVHTFPPPLSDSKKRSSKLVEVTVIGPSHMHLVIKEHAKADNKKKSRPLPDRIIAWYLNDSLPNLAQVYQTIEDEASPSLTYMSHKQHRVESKLYPKSELEKTRLHQGEQPVLRAIDQIFYFEIGFGFCEGNVCMKRIYFEIEDDEDATAEPEGSIDIIAYGHYVNFADGRPVNNPNAHLSNSVDTLNTGVIGEFIKNLPTWSRGGEWTKFPSVLIAETI